MAQLAIKGHPTRGREIIELLIMLGGQNYSRNLLGGTEYNYYYIGNYSTISCIPKEKIDSSFVIFTLEEFLKKFPYKVGDKVNAPCKGCIKTITSMEWDTYLNTVTYKLDNRIYANIDKLKVVNDLHPYVVRKQPKYPKTYEECCEVLNIHPARNLQPSFFIDLTQYEKDLAYILNKLYELCICRYAYWKIAGDWKPEFRFGKKKYCIMTKDNKVISATVEETNRILVFPTEEMRDAFYENFKDLIETVKESL